MYSLNNHNLSSVRHLLLPFYISPPLSPLFLNSLFIFFYILANERRSLFVLKERRKGSVDYIYERSFRIFTCRCVILTTTRKKTFPLWLVKDLCRLRLLLKTRDNNPDEMENEVAFE